MEKPKLQIFNSMSKQKKLFEPIEEGKVGMYVCGGRLTISATSATHALMSPSTSSTGRYLKYLGYEVKYVCNFTDIDDKILENGHAYTIEGDVYYSVDTFLEYYCLSGRKPEDNRAVDTRKCNPADFALWKAAKPGEPSWESLGPRKAWMAY